MPFEPAADVRPTGNVPHVAILLCAYNGERYLAEQLDSIETQTHREWSVWVSDDGSSDGTAKILQEYSDRWGSDRLIVVHGPSRGFAANFLSVACRSEIKADYYAYSDQDDIWQPDKLRRALEHLEPSGHATPTLYCSRTQLIDSKGRSIGFSPLFTREPGFRNALVQNVGGGNTMVFNHAARQLLMSAGPDLKIVAHDWWTYVAVSAAGGVVVYDPRPSLLYRQHGGNLIGSNSGLGARLLRVRLLMRGQLRAWIDENMTGIRRISPRLSVANRNVFDAFLASRDGGPVRRVCGLKRSGVFRQTFMGNVGLFVAALFKKL
ncbi:glycosyltransferase family 2 protein [Bordetella sp. LUAb4]|uniref:glycosyltransferase family 2 protein n=1 Tax=Bordetella sp. LUAb4 TaxID=2843195 RepID=UPI001E58874F|nr:glycosyltransferase family 2 protein [Bordetella sp. LUAb4]